MKESLKKFFAMLAGVDPSDIEMYVGEEDEFIDDIDDEFKGEPEFVHGATNVYRTKKYIVRQMLMLNVHEIFGPHTVSRDIYYERTPERDAEYEKYFEGVADMDGRRIPSMGYVRSYRA